MSPPWLELSPEELSYSSRLGDPLSLRLHCGSLSPYFFGLSGQPHGLHNSIAFLLSLWGGGGGMRLRMSGPSWQPLSTFIHFLFLPSHGSWLEELSCLPGPLEGSLGSYM